MDLIEENLDSTHCYNLEEDIYDNLKIEFNSSKSKIVLWNKYQIFIYESINFKSASKIGIPEYQLHHLLITDNYLLCIDTNGFAHVTTLKFKNPGMKILNCTYQPRDQGIKSCVSYSEDHTLSLKYDDKYFLCLNKINSDYQEVKKVALIFNDDWQILESSKETCILTHRQIDEIYTRPFQKMFNVDKFSNKCRFTMFTLDNLTVYGCLFDEKFVEDQTKVIKIFSCPSEICSIELAAPESNRLLIGLKMGTVLALAVNDLYSCTKLKPEVIHLNKALHKIQFFNSNFMYTDGITMSKAENAFSENISFKQLFVTNVNDFKYYGNTIICTTFNNLIYTFPSEDERTYLKQLKDEYVSAAQVLDNTNCIEQIFKEVEKGKQIAKQISTEEFYLAAMSLSKRHDIMDKVFNCSVTIYKNFEDVIKCNKEEITLTEDISQYYELNPDVYLFLISVKIRCDGEDSLYDVVSSIMTSSQGELHITISNEHKTLKTTSLKVEKINFLIPLHLEDSTMINVNISLIPILPGIYDRNQQIWTILYRKNFKLTSEHFIHDNLNKSLILQKPKQDLENSILDPGHKTLFEFTDITKDCQSYTMYVTIKHRPNSGNLDKYFKDVKPNTLKQMMCTNEFLQLNDKINFMVGKAVVEIFMENDGFSYPQLIIRSGNKNVTSHIRNYFLKIVYGDMACLNNPGAEFVSSSFYTTVKELHQNVVECVTTSATFEQFAPLIEQFEKNVAMLPVCTDG